MSPQQSSLQMVSYGIVAANKPVNSFNIEVTPAETLSMLDGEITDNITTDVQSGVDADGKAFQSTTRTSPTLTAKWLSFGSNRKTAPDVRRGEKVCIWRFADADQYYWSELEYEGSLRKLETVIYAFSGTKDENAKSSEKNTYYLLISTHTKVVQFHTSQADGEAVGYDIVIDTKNSNFQLVDTLANIVFMNSRDNQIVLKTAGECIVDLSDKDLNINVPGNFTVQVAGKIAFKSGGTSAWESGGDFTTKAPNVNFITPKLTTTAILQTGGNVLVGGSLSLAKGMTTGVDGGGGTIQLNGNVESNGNAVFAGSGQFGQNVTAPNIK